MHRGTKPNPIYIPGWEELAEEVKREAGYKCRDCGHPDDWRGGYLLTVHHLDGDVTNNTKTNLWACCQRCHLKRQGTLRLYGPAPFVGLQPTLPGLETSDLCPP